jgi:hypothetical protein
VIRGCTIRPFHTPTHTSLVLLAARLDKVITQGTVILLASAKNNWWLFDLGMLCFFAAATSEISRWNDKRRDFVQISAMVRACHALPREARLCRISQAPPLSCFWPIPGYEKKDLAKGRMMSSVAAAERPDCPYLRHMCRVHGCSSLSTARSYGRGIGPALDTCDPI